MRSHRDKTAVVGRTGGLACAAALFVPLLAPAETHAEVRPLAVALEYSAVSDCPDVSDFKGIVHGRLGYDPFHEAAPRRVLVEIASRAPAFEGRIEWRDAEGNWAGDRTFPSRSADCGELARAMAFALALQIQLSASATAPPAPSAAEPAEPSGTAQVQAPPPSPPPPAPLPSEQRNLPAPSLVAESPTRPRPLLAVGAGALVGFGVASSVVPFGRVFGSIAWPHWSLEMAAEVGLPTTERRAEDRAGFSQQELLVAVAGCGALARWSACLLAKCGALRIAGKDVEEPASPWGPLFETGLRLAVMQPLGSRVYVAARAEGLLLVTRWRVTLDDTPVWTSSRFAETIGLDVGVRFP
ncbi:MAG: hypothetical protein JXP73_05705 [Deltaproteobacteria bacterium]|jgi:hypothetical protein|nr:hypothetical protein [Deltaproteobacteria bacterium]